MPHHAWNNGFRSLRKPSKLPSLCPRGATAARRLGRAPVFGGGDPFRVAQKGEERHFGVAVKMFGLSIKNELHGGPPGKIPELGEG